MILQAKLEQKKTALLNAEHFGEKLQSFAKIPIDDRMISSAETFLVNCVANKGSDVITLNKLRFYTAVWNQF